ncbi:MAG: hypothetical protein ACOVQL_12615 [Limnohabitans sp.]
MRDAHGRLWSGGAAFARLWRTLPGWRWPGWLFALAPMSWLLEGAYRACFPRRPPRPPRARRGWPAGGGWACGGGGGGPGCVAPWWPGRPRRPRWVNAWCSMTWVACRSTAPR